MRKRTVELLLAASFLAASPPAPGAADEEKKPQASKAAPAVINAWVADIPSPGRVTKVEGPVAILNKEEGRYDLLEAGRGIGFDDIVRMTPGAYLEITYGDGAAATFSYGDFPVSPDETGTWVVFKESSPGGGE